MAKGLPFLLLRNSAILKPKNQNEDIWNSNGDVPTVGNTNSCFATHFWGCRSKKWRLSLRNCGCALCFHLPIKTEQCCISFLLVESQIFKYYTNSILMKHFVFFRTSEKIANRSEWQVNLKIQKVI